MSADPVDYEMVTEDLRVYKDTYHPNVVLFQPSEHEAVIVPVGAIPALIERLQKVVAEIQAAGGV